MSQTEEEQNKAARERAQEVQQHTAQTEEDISKRKKRKIKLLLIFVSLAFAAFALSQDDESMAWFDEMSAFLEGRSFDYGVDPSDYNLDHVARKHHKLWKKQQGLEEQEQETTRGASTPLSTMFGRSNHTNNFAVIVSTSRYWQNYRHTANALSFYHICKQNGIPDDRILLFLGDHVACNPRNINPAQVFNSPDKHRRINLYGCDVVVDYRGYEVNVDNFVKVLQGRHENSVTPLSKRLRTNSESNVLIYLTGHGGDGFLKFQDYEFLNSQDLGYTLRQMHTLERFHRLLLVVETCHAESMCRHISSPNVVCLASSLKEQDSYSHSFDSSMALPVIDEFTFQTLAYFEDKQIGATTTATTRGTTRDRSKSSAIQSLLDMFTFVKNGMQQSTPCWTPKSEDILKKWKVGDFFFDASSTDEL